MPVAGARVRIISGGVPCGARAIAGRHVAGEGGRSIGGSKKQNAYRAFVKKHLKTATGATPQQKMAVVAKMWRDRK